MCFIQDIEPVWKKYEELTFRLKQQRREQDAEAADVDMFYYYNIQQSAYWHNQPNEYLPRPLTGSLIWSEHRNHLLLPKESWAAQGLAMLVSIVVKSLS